MSVAALFVALGGTSYAAFRLPPGSVGTKQLANGAVTTPKIKDGAVIASKVARHSLIGADINVGTLGNVPSASNAAHATNADRATTAAAASALGSVAYRADTSAGRIDVSACMDNPCTPDKVGTTEAIATCPGGTVAIGGGGRSYDSGVELTASFPRTFSFAGQTEPNAWQVNVDNWLQTPSKVDYYVVCTATATVDNPSGL